MQFSIKQFIVVRVVNWTIDVIPLKSETIFNKKLEEAQKVMLDVHKAGKGVAGIYSYDIAMTKANTAMNWAKEEGFPFKLSVEEV